MTTTELRIIIDDVQAIAKLKEMKVLSEGVKSSMNNWNSSFTGVLNNLTKVNNAFGKIIQANNMIGHMMVGGAMFGVFNMVHKAFEMIHEVGKEEGLIERTLENLGNTTKIHFEDIKKSSLEISKNLNIKKFKSKIKKLNLQVTIKQHQKPANSSIIIV